MKTLLAALFLTATMAAAQNSAPDLQQLNAMSARFAPTPLRVDTSRLSAGDRQALVKLIEAARIYNTIFMEQLWSGDLALYHKLEADKTPLGQARLHYFWINKGPWADLDEYRAFIPGVPARKPLGANFYPADMTKQEFENWSGSIPTSEEKEAKGFFTVIRRIGGSLRIIPYDLEYETQLQKCATLLREAAALTDNASLKRFLTTRAEAFLSNDYYESDIAWMDLDAPLDITIGPYETYNDELFGYKAAFEAYINLRDDAESAKVAAFSRTLQQVENNLPEDPQYRNAKLGGAAPIRVVNEIIAAGDGAHGVQTAAYNLPNDERVVAQKGAKRVMLKNVQEAKFRSVLIPIATRMIEPHERADVSFDPFFTHILAHELMHGLGPHQITVNGQATNPRQQLKELYSAIEEAKADATGLWALQYMMDHVAELGLGNVLHTGPAAERQLYTTFLASAFRSLRFGLGDAHGKGMAMQFNYIADRGGWVQQPDGTFSVDFKKIKDAIRDLTHDLLTVEATGDYAGARKMLALAVIRPNVAQQLARLGGIPVDIEPQFVTADELAPEAGKAKPTAKKPAPKRKARRRH
ncbi:MAG: dipeptidyl-peptidase 3 family protein [Terriglobales bacterium]